MNIEEHYRVTMDKRGRLTLPAYGNASICILATG
jgi:hypothetical protein